MVPATQKEINDRIKFQVDRAQVRLEQNMATPADIELITEHTEITLHPGAVMHAKAKALVLTEMGIITRIPFDEIALDVMASFGIKKYEIPHSCVSVR